MNLELDPQTQYEQILTALRCAAKSSAIDKNHLAHISKATGLSSKWLSLMANGQITDAGFKRTLRLTKWLVANGYINTKTTNPAVVSPHPANTHTIASGSPVDRAVQPASSFCSASAENRQ